MKILLVSANFITMPYPVYPLGAAAIAEIARHRGHQVKLADLLAENDFEGYRPEHLKNITSRFNPDCLAISLRNLESVGSSNSEAHWSLDFVRQIVRDFREISSAPIVLGGAGFSLMPETALKHSGADYGLAGEGEEIWPAFLDALAAGKAEPGLWAKAMPGTKQVSSYEPELVRAYARRGGLIGVQSKRGCPLNCLYCSYPHLEGRRIRPRPLKEVLEDIARISSIVEFPQIAFADSVFNDPDGHWRELLTAMIRTGPKIRWTAFFQPAEFGNGDLELIKASGASGLEFGTDASNDAALKGLNKNFTFELVKKMQAQCASAGIPAAHYIIFGGPGETPATVEEGIKNIDELEGCVAFISDGLSVYPDTPLFEVAKNEGIVTCPADLRSPVHYYSPEINPIKLHERLRSAFNGRRDRLYPPSRAFELTETLRRLGYRGILWDSLIGSGRRGQRRAADA